MAATEDKLRLILASASPRRKELLGHIGFNFEVITSDIEENSLESLPEDQACDIAEQKGKAVLKSLVSGPECLVISSDTMVVLDGKIYGKPGTKEKARETLLELSGKTHTVITAVSFQDGAGKCYSFFDKTYVTFEKIEKDILEIYLDTGEGLDKAGAYGIQGAGLTFIEKIKGSYSNVVGLPVNLVVRKLKELGYWTKLN